MLRALMKRAPCSMVAWLLVAAPARGADATGVPSDFPRLVLDTGRAASPPPDPDTYRFSLHGEHQLRFQAQRSFLLVPTASAIDQKPGLVEDSIGQNWFSHHWLRISPRLELRDVVQLVGQVDITGVLFGERAHDTRADHMPRDSYNGYSNVQPRWLYVQYRVPFGFFRIGQQPNHWGMGILANDGDHPLLWGDYRYGSISDRILFATKPGGKDSDFNLAIAGDLVFRDPSARLVRGDQAFQGVLAAFFERGPNKLGVYSTLRHQENQRSSASPLYSYTDQIDAVSMDVHGKFAWPVPGHDAFFFGEGEVATVLGSTNLGPNGSSTLSGPKQQIRSYGGAAVLGVVHRSHARDDARDDGRSPSDAAFGDVVGQLEAGYASGDADPYDGTQRRFVFDPNHRVGLLMFDELLRFQTARSATAATDPRLASASRPAQGIDLVPSNGGVFGAQYVNPSGIYRPRPWLDLKGGMVVAQATSDVVDVYRLATSGSYVNYQGGNARKKDLGVELDAGVEARLVMRQGLRAQVGAQGGLLFPGGAFEDTNGTRIKPQWIAIGRLGLLF